MRVFVVTWATDTLDGIFSTQDKAEEFINSGKGTGGESKDYYDVYEYEVDNPGWMGEWE